MGNFKKKKKKLIYNQNNDHILFKVTIEKINPTIIEEEMSNVLKPSVNHYIFLKISPL